MDHEKQALVHWAGAMRVHWASAIHTWNGEERVQLKTITFRVCGCSHASRHNPPHPEFQHIRNGCISRKRNSHTGVQTLIGDPSAVNCGFECLTSNFQELGSPILTLTLDYGPGAILEVFHKVCFQTQCTHALHTTGMFE